ncbi:MAG: oppA 2, partial [Verrucomicrobiaceae bacterium]|nr:oppA 2 [Verrucomicrobiaceae bacterium]
MKSWLLRFCVVALLVAGVVMFDHSRRQRPSPVIAAARAKILLAGNGAEVETLDAHLANGVPEHQVITSMFEGLVASAAANPDDNAPGAAASWENKDFTVWTFHLQPKGRWSDGVPVTAHDFAFSYQRILSPALAADYGQMLYPLLNAEAFNNGTLKDFSQVGVRVIDDLTLQLTLAGPTPYFAGMLKHYSWFGLPRHVIEKFGKMSQRDTSWTKPGNIVGNGPFKLKSWHFTRVLEVERNPFYWDAAEVKLNEIHFFPIVSDATEERAFLDGQLHFTNIVPLSRISTYRQGHDPTYRGEPQLGTYFYRVNTTKPPFNDKRVRRALALAIDRESLIENVTRAGQKPATSLTPADCSAGYHPPQMAKFDPVEARRLLAEAGYPGGKGFPPFEILINTLEMHRTIAEAVQEMWKQQLNIPAGIVNQDWQVYLDTQRRLDFSVARAAWIGDYADPMTFLSTLRSTDGNNNTGWKNARYDELLNQSALETDARKRFDLLHGAEE